MSVIIVFFLIAMVIGYAGVRLLGENPILDALTNETHSESRSYKKGFQSGSKIGQSDALTGKERRGTWAAENGEAAGILEQASDPKEYQKGFHRGYNEGWHRFSK